MSNDNHPDGTVSFSVEFLDQHRARLHLRGDLDSENAGELFAVLRSTFSTGVIEVDIDASAVTFMDTAVLHVIDDWNLGPWRSGLILTVHHPGPAVTRLLHLLDRDELPAARLAPEG